VSEPSLFSRRSLESSGSARLFCIPYAGGSASIYRQFAAASPAWLQVIPVELPGRGRLVKEPLASSLVELAGQIARAIQEVSDLPYAIFGHSLGALLAYQVTAALAASEGPQPQKLFLAGVTPPFLGKERPPLADMDESTLLQYLRAFEGTPEAILNDPSIRDFLLPILRSDFRLVETYRVQEPLRLKTSLTVLWGDADQATPDSDMRQWERAAAGEFFSRTYPGGHFFLNSPEVMTDIVRDLDQLGLSQNGISAR
jgi:medium-chain acyl-[acyl-carrier-protein] hydrolase